MNLLFVGNSFTFYNQMPDLDWELAAAAGHPARVEQIAYGGYRLEQYTDPADEHGGEVRNKLRQAKWDYVVLQEQSCTPALHPEVFLRGTAALTGLIREAGAVPLLYQTWSYRPNSDMLERIHMEYNAFHHALRDAYRRAARECSAGLVPVGDGFYQALRQYPEIDLFQKDNYHPSPAGSYLAALLFYKAVFQETPPPYRCPGLPEEDAGKMRNIAAELLPGTEVNSEC